MAAYDAICFDLDDTLCRSTQDPATLLEVAFAAADCEPFCRHDALAALVPELPPAQTDREFYTNLFAAAARDCGADSATAPSLAEAYLEAVDPTAVEFREGAERALEAAAAVGPVGLITNGGRPTQTRKLRALGLEDRFDAAVFTDPAAGVHPKPDPAPFDRALSTLAVDAGNAIHVGDALHADVAGANAVGMDSAWLADGAAAGDHEPTYALSGLADLASIV